MSIAPTKVLFPVPACETVRGERLVERRDTYHLGPGIERRILNCLCGIIARAWNEEPQKVRAEEGREKRRHEILYNRVAGNVGMRS